MPAERGTDWKSNSALRAPTRSAASGLLLRGPFPFPLAQNASSAASHTCRRPAARRLLLRAAVTTEHGHLGRSSGASQRRILQRTMDDLLEPETHGLGCTVRARPFLAPRARRACHCTRPCASPTPSADLRICAGAWCGGVAGVNSLGPHAPSSPSATVDAPPVPETTDRCAGADRAAPTGGGGGGGSGGAVPAAWLELVAPMKPRPKQLEALAAHASGSDVVLVDRLISRSPLREVRIR